mmetsp:Transcript_24403/g.61335  ORF Transcript_24403/g.61335 Transcript_24403/m.61335 type:complete len:216 (+) Transcript_24403:456-1103(+)
MQRVEGAGEVHPPRARRIHKPPPAAVLHRAHLPRQQRVQRVPPRQRPHLQLLAAILRRQQLQRGQQPAPDAACVRQRPEHHLAGHRVLARPPAAPLGQLEAVHLRAGLAVRRHPHAVVAALGPPRRQPARGRDARHRLAKGGQRHGPPVRGHRQLRRRLGGAELGGALAKQIDGRLHAVRHVALQHRAGGPRLREQRRQCLGGATRDGEDGLRGA